MLWQVGLGRGWTSVCAWSAVEMPRKGSRLSSSRTHTKGSQGGVPGLGGTTTQLPVLEGMRRDGAALPFTLGFGHSWFGVIDMNTQWLVRSSRRPQTCSVASAWSGGRRGSHQELRLASERALDLLSIPVCPRTGWEVAVLPRTSLQLQCYEIPQGEWH